MIMAAWRNACGHLATPGSCSERWCLCPVWVRWAIFKSEEHKEEESLASQRRSRPTTSLHSSHDWVGQELICMCFWCRPVARFPWTRDGLRRWGGGGQMCAVVWWKWIEVGEWCKWVGAEKMKWVLTLACRLVSRDPQAARRSPLNHFTFFRPDPSHMTASLACRTWVSVERVGYRLQSIKTSNRWPTIVAPLPLFFLAPKPYIAHYFTSRCRGCLFPSRSSYPAKIIGRICPRSKSWPRLVRRMIAHTGRETQLSWRGHYRDTYRGSMGGITCALSGPSDVIYQSCQWLHFIRGAELNGCLSCM